VSFRFDLHFRESRLFRDARRIRLAAGGRCPRLGFSGSLFHREGTIMRLSSLLCSSALLLLASDAIAQAGNTAVADTAPISTVQVAAPMRSYWLGPEQAHSLSGYYAMSNGWQMNVRVSSRYLDATIGEDPPMRLVAVSPDKFMTRDGKVTMEFNQGTFSEDMVMSYVEPRLGQVVTLTSQLAQR
jgi:hypothetical protein